MKRVSANRVLLDCNTVENNIMIERDDTGCIIRIVCITDCQVEPSSTVFYNGVITSEIELEASGPGRSLLSLVTTPLYVGYSGRLLLWQHISLCDFRITPETTVREI